MTLLAGFSQGIEAVQCSIPLLHNTSTGPPAKPPGALLKLGSRFATSSSDKARWMQNVTFIRNARSRWRSPMPFKTLCANSFAARNWVFDHSPVGMILLSFLAWRRIETETSHTG